MSESTAVVCSECGKGNYVQSGSDIAMLQCTQCDRVITWGELDDECASLGRTS